MTCGQIVLSDKVVTFIIIITLKKGKSKKVR